ncbi:MAG: GNAT family N-acetyltransferase [Paludibacteraceae bacterium]
MLHITPVQDSDVSRLDYWLHQEHVLKWYHDADEWLMEIKERNGVFRFLNHFIVLREDVPIGFCQYYDCFDAQEEWYVADKPNELYSIDYFIGEESCLRKGYGKEIIRLLVERIHGLSATAGIVVQPEEENVASCKALLANNFVFDELNGFYVLSGKKLTHADILHFYG